MNYVGWKKIPVRCLQGAFDNRGGGSSVFDGSRIPTHEAKVQQPLTLGIDEEVPLKKDGTPDKRYLKKE